MPLTHNEVCEKLKMFDEISLMELLDLSAEDIVDRFEDIIEERRNLFEEDLEG